MMNAAATSTNTIGDRFLAMLPALQMQFRLAFRHFEPERQEDALSEAVADAFTAYVRLWQRGRPEAALPTPLARFAVRHWFAGRRVGTALNKRDVSSPYAQRQKGITLERLDRYDTRNEVWREVALEDRRTPVPDQAAFRIDFPIWLRQLSHRDRRIAMRLAEGARTSEVARTFRLSWARVSQLRREFQESWERFHGELTTE